ncbi:MULTISPECIES: oxygenase MpaB family protein [Streptomyces]|uniref:ER-bound oxygenase mpaB/mpaB'/Rubber oxygenase catalytic domain-containing protein n=1 Tax=Streptomyces demainii TaxID=588122 RepID=A0ABT9KHC2_9ACTN|nr:oxygenase MpaB family protein [Streptomyces demainii]MDP9607813.1 hypothetical protein [Streptomyces demainii]
MSGPDQTHGDLPTASPADESNVLRQAEATYRNFVLSELEGDVKTGLALGFSRTFAIPEIARLLMSTGRLTGHTRARTKATGELMYDIFRHGLDSRHGKATVAALRRLHSPWDISNDAYRYVLACFDLAPMEWCATYGRRAPTDAERAASHTLYLALADRLDVQDVPPTWPTFQRWMRAYEHTHFTPTPEARQLWQATRGMFADRIPATLRPIAEAAADSLLDQPLRHALGVRRPPAPIRHLTHAALVLHARRIPCLERIKHPERPGVR